MEENTGAHHYLKMKRVIVIFIVLIILGLITLAGMEWAKRVETKFPAAVRYSASLEQSGKNNFYIAQYDPLNDTIKLSQRDGVILINSVFAERGWRIDTSTFYLLNKKIPANVYNIIINYTEVPAVASMDFDLVPVNDSIDNPGVLHSGNILIHRSDLLQDTFWFKLFEKNRDSVQQWVESDEVIGFTRKK